MKKKKNNRNRVKLIYKILLVLGVFIGSCIFFASDIKETLFEEELKTTAMKEASFPLVSFEVEGEEKSLPADTEPEVGDDCVLMGNTQYVKRQNYIYISATEDGVPRIDVMDGCSRKGDGGNLRCRVGCLDGIEDDHWTGTVKPNGYGLYSDNAWLKGKFVVRINGVDREVGTMFEVLDGMVRSSVSAMREDMIGGEGCISNRHTSG